MNLVFHYLLNSHVSIKCVPFFLFILLTELFNDKENELLLKYLSSDNSPSWTILMNCNIFSLLNFFGVSSKLYNNICYYITINFLLLLSCGRVV